MRCMEPHIKSNVRRYVKTLAVVCNLQAA